MTIEFPARSGGKAQADTLCDRLGPGRRERVDMKARKVKKLEKKSKKLGKKAKKVNKKAAKAEKKAEKARSKLLK